MTRRGILGIAAALSLAFLAGWMWSASGRVDTSGALQACEHRGDLLGARAAVLDARVATYSVNFGEANAHLEDARGLLARASGRLKALGRERELTQLDTALARMKDAQRMAGKLDPATSSVIGEVAKILSDMLAADAMR